MHAPTPHRSAPAADPARDTRVDDRGAVAAALADADDIVLAGHLPLDGDGLGASLALARALSAAGKRAIALIGAPPARNLLFLPGVDEAATLEQPLPFEPQVFVALDGGSLDRFGTMGSVAQSAGQLINIDHHVTNTHFGDVNWVDASYAATGLMAFDLIRDLGLPLDHDTALSIYTAIVTDTGRFSFSNTSPRVHEAAAELLRLGVEPSYVLRRVYRSLPRSRLRLQEELLRRLGTSTDGRVAWTEVSLEMCRTAGINPTDAANAADIPTSLEGVDVAAVFREREDGIHVSLRSPGVVNVAHFAVARGGGGHPRAAGFTSHEPLDATRERVVAELTAALYAVAP